jgi:cell division protein FtsJ
VTILAKQAQKGAALCALAILAAASAGAEMIQISPSGTISRQAGPGVTSPEGFTPLELPAAARATANKFSAIYANAGARAALSPDLIEAIAYVESRHNPQAVSAKGARGLMQLMPGTAAALGVDAADPAANVAGGASYLRSLLDRYRGETEPVDARPGHIPGAQPLSCRDNVAADGTLLDADTLRDRLTALGAADRPVISYCGSGVTACHTLLVIEHVGLAPGRLYPGSWSQYASQKIGSKGKIMGIDLTEMKIALPNAIFIQGDILTGSVSKWLLEAGFQTQLDGVISDMAPNTTGVKITDQSRSLALCEMAFSVATQHLRKGGYFICKIFDGPDVQQFREGIRPYFGKLSLLKPESTRKESKEFFIIGIDFQGIEGSKGLTG